MMMMMMMMIISRVLTLSRTLAFSQRSKYTEVYISCKILKHLNWEQLRQRARKEDLNWKQFI